MVRALVFQIRRCRAEDPGSTSQLLLSRFASGQLGFLTVVAVVIVFCRFVDCFIGPEKPVWEVVN